MKYKIRVNVELSQEGQPFNPLRLEEQSEVDLNSLSDAAMILVKLHEFFETLKRNKK